MDINNIDISRIVDDMNPPQFRIKKEKEFSIHTLPLTKMREQYFLIKQKEYDEMVETLDTYYYITNDGTRVIGRFNIVCKMEDMPTAGITYHIVDEFQNRGIGQTTLNYVVNELFQEEKVERIIILAVNDRSRNIAEKSGFKKHSENTQRFYELFRSDYLKSKSKKEDIDDWGDFDDI